MIRRIAFFFVSTIQLQAQIGGIQELAIKESSAYRWLEQLSDGIGGRLTGSPEAAKAEQWAADTMKQIGLANIHLERYKIDRGWQRGTAQAEIVSPIRLPLNATSYGWAGSTPSAKGLEASVVLVKRDSLAAEMRNSAAWAGKILCVSSTGGSAIQFYSQLGAFVIEAQKQKAAAIILRDARPGAMLTHTGPVTFDGAIYTISVLDISAEHQLRLERLLKAGTPVRLRITVSNRFSSGPVEAANVVGEIAGREQAEQVVILSAHLDSWDLGTGAIDDGAGVATVLGAAEAIVKSGKKPRRTIRFILFTGEEQGLLGSRAYVRQHKAEMPNVICALALDWGQGPIAALPLAGRNELTASFAELSALVKDVQPLEIVSTYLTFTDAYSFTLAGVAGLAFYQNSKDYTLIGHSAADMFDKVDAAVLSRNTATAAITAFWIADHTNRIAAHWSQERVVQQLVEDKQRPMLEALGLWAFPQ